MKKRKRARQPPIGPAIGRFDVRRINFAAHIQFQPRQMVAISASSCIYYILAAQAVWWAGRIFCPINNTLHPGELAKAVDLLQPDYLVVDESVYAKVPALIQTSKNTPRALTIGKGSKNSSWPSFPLDHSPDDNEDQLELPNPIPSNPRDCAAILLSSGATGMPKAVMLSHSNLVATCYRLHHDNPQNWRSNQREISFPPLSHVYALYVCFTMCCWLGAYVCLMPRFELELYCRLMQDRLATLVPPVAKLLAEQEVVTRFRYPDLEYFSCLTAPLHACSPSFFLPSYACLMLTMSKIKPQLNFTKYSPALPCARLKLKVVNLSLYVHDHLCMSKS